VPSSITSAGEPGAREIGDVAALARIARRDVNPMGEQQLAALQHRRHVRVLAGMHPADRPRELRLTREDLRDALAHGGQRERIGDRQRRIGP
jgi:hypothetical protein